MNTLRTVLRISYGLARFFMRAVFIGDEHPPERPERMPAGTAHRVAAVPLRPEEVPCAPGAPIPFGAGSLTLTDAAPPAPPATEPEPEPPSEPVPTLPTGATAANAADSNGPDHRLLKGLTLRQRLDMTKLRERYFQEAPAQL